MNWTNLLDFFRAVYRRLMSDVWRKLIALLLALLAWFGVRWYLMQQQTIRVQVRVEYDAQKYHLSSDQTSFTVWMSVRRLNREDGNSDWTEALNYDLCVSLPEHLDSESGEYRFTVNDIVGKKLPDNVRLVAMEPEAFSVQYDTLVEKDVPVVMPEDIPLGVRKVVFTGSSPGTVRLRGPSEYLRDLVEISPDISGVREQLQQSIPKELRLFLRCPYDVVRVHPGQVDMAFHTEQLVRDTSETFSCEVRALGLSPSLRLSGELPVVTVEVTGPPRLFDDWRSRSVLAVADFTGVEARGEVKRLLEVAGIPSGLRYRLVPFEHVFTVEEVRPPSADSSSEASGARAGALSE